MDRESLEFFTRIRNGFLKEHDLDPERWVKVNADQAPELVLKAVKDALGGFLF
jgi:thymidylate kinase